MSWMGGRHSIAASGKYQYDTKVSCNAPNGERVAKNITVYADDKEEARVESAKVAESYGYTNCRTDKIVCRGNWQH